MTKDQLALEIQKRYGFVTRARNCFLYTKKGVRLTDMFQEGGRAILGWEGGSAFTHFKNYLSKGLTGSFICEDKSRLKKAVSTLLASERNIYFFNSRVDALKAALLVSPDNTSVFLPWALNSEDYAQIGSVIIEPPLPWTDNIFILAVKSELISPDTTAQPENSTHLPFALQAAISRAIYNLIEQIPLRQEKDWFVYDTILTKYWTRKGPYLQPKVPQEKYDDFVLHCLDLGIVINPSPDLHSLIPFGADKGVFTKLKNSPFNF